MWLLVSELIVGIVVIAVNSREFRLSITKRRLSIIKRSGWLVMKRVNGVFFFVAKTGSRRIPLVPFPPF